MHLSLKLALLLLPLPSLANFHIGTAEKWTNPVGSHPSLKTKQYIACPSNYLNCNCYGGLQENSDRGVGLVGGTPNAKTFSLKAGLCGMGQLDFYYRDDKGHYEFYVHGGDGSLQGTCFKNSATDWCIRKATLMSTSYSDNLVCYSYICGQ